MSESFFALYILDKNPIGPSEKSLNALHSLFIRMRC